MGKHEQHTIKHGVKLPKHVYNIEYNSLLGRFVNQQHNSVSNKEVLEDLKLETPVLRSWAVLYSDVLAELNISCH